jgi:hypothetical protein
VRVLELLIIVKVVLKLGIIVGVVNTFRKLHLRPIDVASCGHNVYLKLGKHYNKYNSAFKTEFQLTHFMHNTLRFKSKTCAAKSHILHGSLMEQILYKHLSLCGYNIVSYKNNVRFDFVL